MKFIKISAFIIITSLFISKSDAICKDDVVCINNLKLKNSTLAKKIPATAKKALDETLEKYLVFLKTDNDFRYSIGQFQGSGRYTWGENSQYIMLDFYQHAMDNLIHSYPNGLKVKTSKLVLDTKLNSAYKQLMFSINKIPESYSYPWSTNKLTVSKQLILAEHDWISFRDAYVHFAKVYYKDKYSANDIQSVATAYLIRRRLMELKDQQYTVKTNLDANWYDNPW